MEDNLARIKKIGFTRAGCWKLSENEKGIVFELNELAVALNVLYAFAVDGGLMYVGKTVLSLRQRMQGYKTPAKTQRTNINNNAKITASLGGGKVVEIYVLPDNGLMHYGEFHINLAAGLEDSLVRVLNPPWNGGKLE